MEKRAKEIIIYSLFIIVVIFAIGYVYKNYDEFSKIRLVNPIYIISLVILTILFSISYGLLIKYLAEPFKIKLKIREWFGLSIITSFYNILAPITGGIIPKALYLKKKHNFHYTSFLASLSGIYITHFFVGAFLGIISLLLIKLSRNIFHKPLFFIFLAIFFVSSYIIIFSPKIKEPKNKIVGKFVEVLNGWHMIKNNRKIIAKVCIITIIQTILNTLGIMLAFDIFDIKLGVTSAFFLASTGFIGGFSILTPGLFGISEAIAVLTSSIIGISVAQSLTIALLGRAIATVTILALGPIFSYVLLNHAKEDSQIRQ